jgi:hypothetical protein
MMRTILSSFGLVVMMALACAQPFTYQGLLKQSGTPANGTYDFEFALFNAPTGGTQVGSTLTINDLNVQNGLFTVELNFGSVWDGSPRYLEIRLRPGTSTGSYQQLLPRVKINPTPYASAIRLFESGVANPDRMVIAHSPAYLDWGLQYQDAPDKFNFLAAGTPVMTVDLGTRRVGIGTNSPGYPLHVQTNTGDRAIFGVHTATSGGTYGVWGQSSSSDGRGVYGWASAASGFTYGVFGESSSPNGRGVYGYATAASGTNYGVFGRSDSPSGTGVYGEHAATSGTTPGVHGRTESISANAVGVLGEVAPTSPGGSSAAVRGINRGTGGLGIGVWGSHDGGGWGVLGTSVSGIGVYGQATANSGTNYGVYGVSNSPDGFGGYFSGRGYFGYNSSTSNATLRLHETQADFARLEFTNTNTARKWHIAGFIGATQADDRLNIWNSAAGDILSVRGDGTVAVKVLEITGADLAEKFPVSEPDIEPGMVVEIDPDQPGNLRLARGAYNRRVVGVVAGANGLSKGIVLGNLEGSDHHVPIAISGRVWVYADATEQAIEPGDFLTTAARPGYAMKANDLRRAQGAIIGKAMTRLEKGKTGLVLVLVNLQ